MPASCRAFLSVVLLSPRWLGLLNAWGLAPSEIVNCFGDSTQPRCFRNDVALGYNRLSPCPFGDPCLKEGCQRLVFPSCEKFRYCVDCSRQRKADLQHFLFSCIRGCRA